MDVGVTDVTSETEPVRPRLASVIVAEPDDDPQTIGVDWLAVIVNEGLTVTDNVAECEIEPYVPVIVSVYTPDGVEAVVEIDIADVEVLPGLAMTLTGVKEIAIPVAELGATAVRVSEPARPMLPILITLLAELPATRFAGVEGPAEIVKSGTTVKVRVAEEERLPLVPIIVIVYVDAAVELVVPIVSVDGDVPPSGSATDVGVNDSESPDGVDPLTVAIRLTLPENP